MACEHPAEKLVKRATEFIVSKKGTWGHDDWEAFCKQAASEGIELNEHNKVALGNLLEAVRYFYQLSPAAPAAPAKKRAPCKKSAGKTAAAK